MIRRKGNLYKLDTPNTTLLIETANGTAQYVYYGKRLTAPIEDYQFLKGREGVLENGSLKLLSSFGDDDLLRGGIACRFEDGSFSLRFTFQRAKTTEKPELSPLPSSYSTGEDQNMGKTLCLEFLDEASKLKLSLYYTVFEDSDVITVSSKLYNGRKKAVRINALPSLQLDVRGDEYEFVTFRGEWANERNKISLPVNGAGVIVNESRIGSSSHHANPFVMLKKEGTVYAFNLVYSGNHKESAEADITQTRTRVLVGMNDFMFDKKLEQGESFSSPEAVMCYAPTEDEISARMHAFVSNHIIHGKWKEKERPILINNWEATYFDFNKDKLLALADEAVALGVELFVLDDGWFGHRDADDSSLGDWFDYEEKTGGIAQLAEEVRARGLKFGIWVEPEAISEDSELYRKHPEYAMKIPGREPMRMRRQLMLNLADVNVQKYLIRTISAVISETKASYLKWDYNRRMSDCYSKEFGGGEYFHEYIKGYYTVIGKIVERFPSLLIEGCASGGGRFDLGALYFTPQIWTSDNTDARCRLHIQSGTSYAYPQSAISCHVSASPNHQTGNASALETRFNVAMCGAFGYELDITKLPEKEKTTIKKQIAFYKKYRKVLQFGDFYRLNDAFAEKESGFVCVNANKSLAIAVIVMDPQWGKTNRYVRLKGLDEGTVYEVNYREQDNYPSSKKFLAGGELLMNGGILLNEFPSDSSPERSANGLYSRCLVLKKISPKLKKSK